MLIVSAVKSCKPISANCSSSLYRYWHSWQLLTRLQRASGQYDNVTFQFWLIDCIQIIFVFIHRRSPYNGKFVYGFSCITHDYKSTCRHLRPTESCSYNRLLKINNVFCGTMYTRVTCRWHWRYNRRDLFEQNAATSRYVEFRFQRWLHIRKTRKRKSYRTILSTPSSGTS